MLGRKPDIGEEESAWSSISDLMSGLMAFFLLVAVSFLFQSKGHIKVITEQQDTIRNIISEYRSQHHNLYALMDSSMGRSLDSWGAKLDSATLTIRFEGEETKFQAKSSVLPTGFTRILDEFIPKFLSVVLDDDFEEEIIEIRLEGHAFTDPTVGWYRVFSISQARSRAVLLYFKAHPAYLNLSFDEKQKIDFKLVSMGMGDSRLIDENGAYSIYSKNPPCPPCSRRVEFSIKTASERVVELIQNRIDD